MSTSSQTVKAANKASSATLAGHISTSYEFPTVSCRIQVLHSCDLDQSQRDSIWAVFEGNMYDFYINSSFGWDPEAKRKELFHSLSRFILVYSLDTDEVLAFTMFRFEVEEEEDVIYCYDIQVKSSAQGMGLGKRLLNELAKLCQVFGMKKIMLTVLKANVKALAFYRAIGYDTDPTSPNYVDSDDDLDDADSEEEDVDYEILSKYI